MLNIYFIQIVIPCAQHSKPFAITCCEWAQEGSAGAGQKSAVCTFRRCQWRKDNGQRRGQGVRGHDSRIKCGQVKKSQGQKGSPAVKWPGAKCGYGGYKYRVQNRLKNKESRGQGGVYGLERKAETSCSRFLVQPHLQSGNRTFLV